MIQQIEPWMVRTALVIGTLFVLDGALYVLSRRLQRREPTEPRSRITEVPPRESARAVFGARLEHDAWIHIAPTGHLIH